MYPSAVAKRKVEQPVSKKAGRRWADTPHRADLFEPVQRDPEGIAKLRAYLNAMSVAQQTAFAEKCGVTLASLRRVLWKGRCTPELALAIEKASDEAITRDVTYPEWKKLWGDSWRPPGKRKNRK